MNQEDKNKVISGGSTLLLMAIVVVVLLTCGGFHIPDPPIPEEGVEVNLGNSDNGYGDNPMPNASEASSAPRPASATEQVSTQRTESTTPIPSSDKPSTAQTNNTTPTTTKPEPPKEPEINTKALFNGSKAKNNGKGGSEGKTFGSGNQGKEGGDPNSNRYDGALGNGGSGFSLTGRSAKALPSPQGGTQKQGKIVVKIRVDRAGNVIGVEAPEKGSTLTDGALVNQAKQAAMKAKFSPKEDAPEVQVGTITYVFRNS